MNGYLFLALAFILNSLGTIAVKIHSVRGFQAKGNLFQIAFGNIYFFTALALFGLNLVAYSLALGRLPLSVAYPIMTVASFIIVNTFSFFYFRESITAMQVVGYVLILTGITFVITFAKQ